MTTSKVVPLVRDTCVLAEHALCGIDRPMATDLLRADRFPVWVGSFSQKTAHFPLFMQDQWDAVPSAISYQWRYATAAAPTVWTQEDPITTARYTLQAVVACTQYIVQECVFATTGPSDWSDSATMMAA
jgi:hypothetical protein